MTTDGGPARDGQPDVDPQRIGDPERVGDPDLHIYEAIATLEYLGRPVTRAEIGAAVSLDGAELDERLGSLTERGLLVRSTESGEPAFTPAQRGWSAVPDEAAGPQRLS
jgi:hypothetical protein